MSQDLLNQLTPEPKNGSSDGLRPEVMLLGSHAISETLKQDNLPWEHFVDSEGRDAISLPEAGIVTTLPESFFHIDEKGAIYMDASSIDALPDGEYSLSDGLVNSTITVTTNKNKKFFTSDSTSIIENGLPKKDQSLPSIDLISVPPGFGKAGFAGVLSAELEVPPHADAPTIRLLKSIGLYSHHSSNSLYIPSPNTVSVVAQENDLPLLIINERDEHGAIPVEDYLSAFAKGLYPIGTGNLAVYAHDVKVDDHLPGAILLGREGLEQLSPLAIRALQEGGDKQQLVSSFYDRFTNTLRSLLDGSADVSGVIGIYLTKSLQEISEMATELRIEIDTEKLLSHIKSRLKFLHEQVDLGSSYSEYIKLMDSVGLEITPIESDLDLPKRKINDDYPIH